MYNLLQTGWMNPWRKLHDMERAMNRLYDEFSTSRVASFPPVNIYTDTDGARLTAEIPGIDPADLEITVNERELSIHGERKPEEASEDRKYHRRERTFGTFARSIQLPFAVNSEKVDAKYHDGILEIRLERSEAEKPRKITVK